MEKQIITALISVYNKDSKIEKIIRKLNDLNVKLISTGGTYDFIQSLGIEASKVEDITSYPSILGGRVKTLHPKIFGGILSRKDNQEDIEQTENYEIPSIDLVIVDLYPFEETLLKTNSEEDIIEKIDIGGISLIRAAAKNFQHVLVIPSSVFYDNLFEHLEKNNAYTSLEYRKYYAMHAFNISSYYDSIIFKYFNRDKNEIVFKENILKYNVLRYGENPHQKGIFFGDFEKCFTKLNGKEISYNNLIDIDSAVGFINEFSEENVFGIIKHTNLCGAAINENLKNSWLKALAADPVSAFGGIIVTNKEIDMETAEEINKLFFEILIAASFEKNALELLKSKKNRIILQNKNIPLPDVQFKSVLNGIIQQDKDMKKETVEMLQQVTIKDATHREKEDLLFANIIVKHNKSNSIVLVKDKQLIGIGTGQTSRVDAVEQAINKANKFGFSLKGAVMASDAFFPFSDCAQIAHNAGITAIIQPGGSIRDNDSIEYCNKNNLAMVFTGLRHFKH